MQNSEYSLNQSRQTTGLDFVLGAHYFDNASELYYCDKFSCIKTIIDGFPSIVIINTVMYPEDFVEIGVRQRPSFVRGLRDSIDKELFLSSDIYYMGVGLSQKNAPESERRVFEIGKRYTCHVSEIYLCERHVSPIYGYSLLHPIELSGIPDEYHFAKRLCPMSGTLLSAFRGGNISGVVEHIIDKWFVLVKRDRLVFRYALFLDPYAKTESEPLNSISLPYGFTLK